MLPNWVKGGETECSGYMRIGTPVPTKLSFIVEPVDSAIMARAEQVDMTLHMGSGMGRLTRLQQRRQQQPPYPES